LRKNEWIGNAVLALPLFVARVAAHDVHHAPAAHNFAVVAQTLNAGADFHDRALPDDKQLWAESLSV
jgi:hypothetical protein